MATIWVGYDPIEQDAFEVAWASIHRHLSPTVKVRALKLSDLKNIYHRPMRLIGDELWDVVSNHPMSTEFALSRFFVPRLDENEDWALFIDGDVLVRRDLARLFDLHDSTKALQCVQHDMPWRLTIKKGGRVQSPYRRKNWSSVMLFNLRHEAHCKLTLTMLNTTTGIELHQFCWLKDNEIGPLPLKYNWLVNISQPCDDPAIVHFTEGTPNIAGHERDPFASEWRDCLAQVRGHGSD